jgi:hypothetical protein
MTRCSLLITTFPSPLSIPPSMSVNDHDHDDDDDHHHHQHYPPHSSHTLHPSLNSLITTSTTGLFRFAPAVTVWFRQLQRINLGSKVATTFVRVRPHTIPLHHPVPFQTNKLNTYSCVCVCVCVLFSDLGQSRSIHSSSYYPSYILHCNVARRRKGNGRS